MLSIEGVHRKIFNAFHRTRITHDIHFSLTVEETEVLLAALFDLHELLDKYKENQK